MYMAKSRLGTYGIKRSGKWGKLSAVERAEWNFKRGNYFKSDSSITKRMRSDLVELLKETRKRVNSKLDALRKYKEETGNDSPSLEWMKDDIKMTTDLDEILLELARARNFEQQSTSTVEGTEKFFDEVDPRFDEATRFATIHDRWTIARRIIALYPMYTISEVLDMIDAEMEANKELTVDEITSNILESLKDYWGAANDFENGAHRII